VVALEPAKKTTGTTGMASYAALLIYHQQDYIAVAIEPQLRNFLNVSGLFSLTPDPATGARPVYSASGARRFHEGRTIHPGNHQDLAGLAVLRYRRHQARVVPTNLIQPVVSHSRTSI
jgi:hypothetical protein